MMTAIFSILKRNVLTTPALWLVFSLISLILLPLFTAMTPAFKHQVFGIFLFFVIVTGLLTIKKSVYYFAMGILLGVMAITLVFLSLFMEVNHWVELSRATVLLCLSAYIGKNVFDLVYSSKKVNKNIIYASIAGYLLIGIIGGQACFLLELLAPNSFTHQGEYLFYDFQYFSFVTLTTLGYGDITPVSPQAKAVTLLISLMGQLYLTVIIAILVGKYIARSTSR